jgi:outer membrane protein
MSRSSAVLLFFMLLVLSSLVHAQAKQAITGKVNLKQVLTAVLERNYRIQLSEERKQIADNNVTFGNAGMLPTLNASGNYNASNTNVTQEFSDASRATIKANGVSNTGTNLGLALNWTVFDGFRMFASLDRLKYLQKNGVEGVRINMINTLSAATLAYYNLYQQSKKLVVLQNAVSVSEDRVVLAKSKYEVGSGIKLEYLNAQVDLNTDKSNLLLQQKLVNYAQTDLNVLLVQAPETALETTDTLIPNNSLSEETLRASLLSQNPTVLALMHQQDIAYQDLRILQSQLYPNLALGAAYNLIDNRNGAGFLKRTYNSGIQYGLSATWNIYNGNNVQRNIQNQKINQEIAKLRVDSLTNELSAAMHKSYIDYTTSQQLLTLEQANSAVALQNVSIAQDRYRIGVSTPLEFREAQRNLIAAQNRLIEALFAQKQAEVELLRLSGKDIFAN